MAREKPPAAAAAPDLAPPAAPRRPARRMTATDTLEREADRAAEHVVAREPAPRFAARAAGSGAPPAAANLRAGTAQALPDGLRSEMERGFAHDFSHVRVHADAAAAASAHEREANAYTTGRDIVFGEGRYAPQTTGGRRLIAHELAHVVQQASGAAPVGAVQREPRDPDELAAEAKEEDAIVAKAKRVLASDNPAMDVHEIVWRLINNHHLDEHFELNGSRYEATRKGIVVELSGKGPRTTGTIVAGKEVLQRLAAGKVADVVKEIESQIGTVGTARGTVDLVFIMGADAPKSSNRFYAEAVAYFKAEHAGATMFEDVRDLDGINQRINSTGKPVANLIIVSHAHPDGTLQFSLNASDKTPGQVQFSELKEANATAGVLTQPDPKLVGFWTNVSIRGCNLGRSADTMAELKTAFGGEVRVLAPTHAQRYGGGTQSIAGPFYEEKGSSKLKDEQALELIRKKPEYAFITDWDRMRPTLKRRNVGGKPATYYDQPFPAAGKEMDFLADRKGKAFAKDFTFTGTRIEGGTTVFEYRAKDPAKPGVEIDAETPPTDAQAEALARAEIADPDTYAYEVKRTRTGLQLKVEVTARKTEWELYHSEIKKKGKSFNPREGSKPWFGDTGW